MKVAKLYKGNYERLSTVKMSLENIGLKAEEVKKDELIKLLYNYYNPRVGAENLMRGNVDDYNLG